MAQDPKLTCEKLSDLLSSDENTLSLPLEKKKYIIFSDMHLGDRGKADDFRQNDSALLEALKKYKADGFDLILLGDIEELWQFDFNKIFERYCESIYKAIRDFGDEHVIRVFGNHDIDWRVLKDPCKTKQIQKKNSYEAIKLIDKDNNIKFILVHGHQGNLESDKASWSSRFFVRCFKIVEPILKSLGITAHPPALRSQITTGYDKIFYDWAKKNNVAIICGHSHRAIFASRSYFQRCKEKIVELEKDISLNKDNIEIVEANKKEIDRLNKEIKDEKRRNMDILELDDPDKLQPCYFNSGCALFKDGITGIEIIDGEIKLIKWERDPKADPRYIVYQKGLV